MKYLIDIDGTICTNTDGDYESAQPFKKRINLINSLYEQGNTIWYYTARGMNRLNNNADNADSMFRNITEEQLSKWGVKYHKLILGKPSADYYIDDKSIEPSKFFGE